MTKSARVPEDLGAERAITRDQQTENLVTPVSFLVSTVADVIREQTLNIDGGTFMLSRNRRRRR